MEDTFGTEREPLKKPIQISENNQNQMLIKKYGDSNFNKVMYVGFVFMILYSAFNSSQNLLVVIIKMIGYPYLGYYILGCLYCCWGIFNLFAPGWCYYIKDYSLGLSLSTTTFILFLGSGFYTLTCYESSSCEDIIIYSLFLFAAFITSIGKSVIWILG